MLLQKTCFWGNRGTKWDVGFKKELFFSVLQKRNKEKKKEKGLARTPFVGAVQNREKMKVRTFLILISFFLIILWLD